MTDYLPEGGIINSAANKAALQNISSLQEAYRNGVILESRALVCSAAHDLLLDLNGTKAVIPRVEGALGIESGHPLESLVIAVGEVRAGVAVAVDVDQAGDDGGTV